MPAPEILLAAFLVLALNVYAITGGADFGGGVWDLLASGPTRERQRLLVKTAVGPIWEANHVWLIVVIVVLFAGFPPAYTAIMTALHVPLTLVLLGVVLRGSAFVFKGWALQGEGAHRAWERVFEWASLCTPVMLGVSLGAVTTGNLRMDMATRRVTVNFVDAWWSPFPWLVGLVVLVVFSHLAAVYLAHEAREDDLREAFRVRGLASGAALGVVALGTLAAARTGAPMLFHGLVESAWAIPFHLCVGALAVASLGALWKRRWGWARILSAGVASLVVWGLALAQGPHLVVPDITVHNAAAPASVINIVLVALGAGSVLLVPSFLYLFRVFQAHRA